MLKKDIQPRPAYLKWAYIGMMTIGFVDGGGFPLPWFTKYVMQMGVLGLAILFLLVTGDFRRLGSGFAGLAAAISAAENGGAVCGRVRLAVPDDGVAVDAVLGIGFSAA